MYQALKEDINAAVKYSWAKERDWCSACNKMEFASMPDKDRDIVEALLFNSPGRPPGHFGNLCSECRRVMEIVRTQVICLRHTEKVECTDHTCNHCIIRKRWLIDD